MKLIINIIFVAILFSYSGELISQTRSSIRNQVSGVLLINDAQFSSNEGFKANPLIQYRYIPEIESELFSSNIHAIDILASANIFGDLNSFSPFWESPTFNPYRLWARYQYDQVELRLGLQKIDFGSATFLRPLQWFNQVDPRDPLGITNGVYGALFKYYSLNNSTVWLWGLVGNDERKGLELFPTIGNQPEFGGRFSFQVPNGEMGFTYNHRKRDMDSFVVPPNFNSRENRLGLDVKWDYIIGIWFEASYQQFASQEILKNTSYYTIGADYTFEIGNGLNVVAEYLFTRNLNSLDGKKTKIFDDAGTTLLAGNYPISLFSQFSVFSLYNWEETASTTFLNYQIDQNPFQINLIGYHTDSTQQGFTNQNNLALLGEWGAQVLVVLTF